MKAEELRPNPDALLAEIAAPPAAGAKLRVFLGMCPGVGKTFAMLQAARAHASGGREVLVGVVETHGRKETAELTQGLEILPLKVSHYRGVEVREMDLDALLARHPEVAVVDELAHTNAPGSRHLKRHQDVRELLDAGISVWTTLNIQHVESRADVVSELTGVKVRETVPDTLLDRADEVVLIDLAPEQLRQRLQEGRVYQAERAATAADQFFRMGNLTALRELALRFAAERAGRDFREFAAERKRSGPLRTNERLMVAIGPSPTSESLIRWTRRAAGMLDASWLGVTVDTGVPLSEAARARLTRHVALAHGLGGEVISTSGQELTAAVLAVAREQHVTQIVVGKPERPLLRWRTSMLERLIAESGDIDIHVVRPRREGSRVEDEAASATAQSTTTFWRECAAGLALVALITGAGLLVEESIGYWSVALLYLLGVLLAALWLGRWPILLTGALSALAWNFLFIPPKFTFYITRSHDAIMFGMYFVVALVIGQTTAQLRRQQQMERRREQRTATLLGFAQLLSSAPDEAETMKRAVLRISELSGAPLALHRRNDDDYSLLREPVEPAALRLTEKEWSVASWVQGHRQAAGRFTATLPDTRVICLPVQTRTSIMGVLALAWPEGRSIDNDERQLLESLCGQLGLALEKEHLMSAMRRADVAEQSTRLQKALLDSVSHELKTPIAALRAALDLQSPPADERSTALQREMQSATTRLERVTTQLLDMTRIEGGQLRPQKDWCDVEELLHAIRDQHLPVSARDRLVLSVEPEFAPVFTDAALLESIITNLVINALTWSPPGAPVRVSLRRDAGEWELEVRDHGPGIAPDDLSRIFAKFYRAGNAPSGGTGLGLSIVSGFSRALGGSAAVRNAPDGGAAFTVRFPSAPAPDIPPPV